MERRIRLKEYVKSRPEFSWEMNCCYFVTDWLKELGYPDYATDYKSKVKDKRTAALMLRQLGDKLVRNLPDKYFVRTDKPKAGDIALGINQYNLGIYAGGGYSFFIDGVNKHIRRLPKQLVKTYWRVV